ncbi:NAD(P)-binding protein [Atractiella rhizophila]|nr:NAD(P)-binding protein [Atractiella rhizophila]
MLSQASDALKVAIFGITGKQGSSVLKALRASPKAYNIIGLTRDASKEPAVALSKEEGVQIISVTFEVGKEEEVKKALDGAEAVFLVTNFWNHLDVERDFNETKVVIDAALSLPTVKTFLWSGLPSYAKLTGGKYTKVYHFEGKARATDYLFQESKKKEDVRAVSVEPAAYMQNFLQPPMEFQKGEDGVYVLSTGWKADTKLASIDIQSDYGIFVQSALEHPTEFPNGSIIQAVGEDLTMNQIVEQFAAATGEKAKYAYTPFENSAAYSHMPPIIQEDFKDFYGAINEVEYYGKDDFGKSLGFLSRKPHTWKKFFELNKKTWAK